MKKETKELLRVLGVAFLLMMAVPLVYRVVIHFWPPEEKPRRTISQFFEEAQMTRCMKLLTTPVAKWSDDEAKSEPEIYAWLKEQGNEILPWEWTDEARRKDQKGYAKCWRRIWRERKSCCERLLAGHQTENKRLGRELQIITTIHAHRTNQIERLRAIAATNSFPCQIALERLTKGRFWGWNKKAEVIECKNVAEITVATNSICSIEMATAEDEVKSAKSLSDSLASSKEKSIVHEKLCEICDRSNGLIENEISADNAEILQKSLVKVLKGAKK